MRAIEVQGKKVKKFDEIELLCGPKMVDYIQVDENNMIIYYMDKSKTFCLTNENVKVNRPKRTYTHIRYEPIKYN